MAAADRLQRLQEIVAADPEPVRHCEQQVLDGEVLVAHLATGFVGPLEGVVEVAAERRLGAAVGLRDPGERVGDPVADRERRDAEAVEDGDGDAAVL